jgi:hypothetical protein
VSIVNARFMLFSRLALPQQICCFLLLLSVSAIASSAPKKLLLPEWQASDESSQIVADHSLWQQVLDQYVVTRDVAGSPQTYVNYAELKQVGDVAVNNYSLSVLDNYIAHLSTINPLTLTRKEQQAYWVNLYNAATVQLIVQKYPVASITKLGKGFFSFGPWNDKIATVNQTSISLNDIEHGILRPIYDDPRIHYAVNCASFSCPNLLTTAFTGENTESLLEKGARDYINHTRGVTVDQDRLVLSTIYDWFQEDFGGSEDGVLAHIKQYASTRLLERVDNADSNNISYAYDWALNEFPLE